MNIIDLYFENTIEEIEPSLPKSKKLDIFYVLSKIENRDFNFYSTLDDEQKKALSPYILNKWMSVSYSNRDNQEYYISAANFINEFVFELGKDTELLWKLLCCMGTKKNVKHGWIKVSSTNNNLTKLQKLFLDFYPHLSTNEIDISIKKTSLDNFQDMLNYTELSDKECTLLLKDFKALK
jgi:hypothetical protein